MALSTTAIVRPRERTNTERKPVSNKILLSIPDTEFLILRPHLEFLPLPHHLSLYEPNQKIEFAYFPNGGMISLVVVTEDGRTVEVGVVGSEGFAGAGLLVGLKRSSVREEVQIAGDGFRLGLRGLHAALPSTPRFQWALSHYAVLLGMQVAQTAACNRLHAIEQRLARWLLVTQDRVDTGVLPITHDFLATMLGTDRPTLSIAAAALQKKGILRYNRGALKILNRKALERISCECYAAIRQFNGELGLK